MPLYFLFDTKNCEILLSCTSCQARIHTTRISFKTNFEYGWFLLTTRIGKTVRTGLTGILDRSRWFCQNADLTSPLRSSRRDDQNAYMKRPIWNSDERVMTSRRFDPHPDRSNRLDRAVRPVQTAQSELGVVF